MQGNQEKSNSIARRIFISTLVFGFTLTLVTSFFFLFQDYRNGITALEKRLDQIQISYLPALADSVWVANEQLIREQLESLLGLPDVQWAEVRGALLTNDLMAGKRKSEKIFSRQFPITHTFKDRNLEVGTLYVEADMQDVWRRSLNHLPMIILLQGLIVILISSVIFLSIHFLLINHLKRVYVYLRDFNIHQPGNPLELTRKKIQNDEIDQTVKSINNLRLHLTESYTQLEDANERLEHDISERQRIEESLRKSEQFVQNILDTVDVGVIVVDKNYRVLKANKAYLDQISLSGYEVIGKTCFEISHKSQMPCHEAGEDCAVKHVFDTGQPGVALHRHEDNKGNVLYVEIKAFPLQVSSGVVTSAIEMIHNITERHLLEAEQLKTQKLEAIGTLAGGIAHDFNNLLQGVFGYVSIAKLSADNPEKVSEMLNQAERALSMSVSLTTQLLTFAKGGKPQIKKTDLKPVIENASKFALSGSTCNYQLTIADLWPAEVDAGQVAQVIQNIVLNASEAMPGGGSIDISAKNIECFQEDNALLPRGGKFIQIMIRDTGVGIPDHYLPRIFDPYFTTKKKGSGLGLATSYSIIRNHGGTIEVTSKPETGTIFIIYLPAIEEKLDEAARAFDASEATATRKCRILVMDDEEIILDVAKAMLMTIGHDVEVSRDGESAIEKYRQALATENPFDLVILDLTIKGGLGGEATMERLLELDPNVKAVVASGYSDNPVLANFKGHGFSAVLSKPYSLGALRGCLNPLIS